LQTIVPPFVQHTWLLLLLLLTNAAAAERHGHSTAVRHNGLSLAKHRVDDIFLLPNGLTESPIVQDGLSFHPRQEGCFFHFQPSRPDSSRTSRQTAIHDFSFGG
jgi:hypothetical protein